MEPVVGKQVELDWKVFLHLHLAQHLLLLLLWRFLSKGLVLLSGLLFPMALVKVNEGLLSELRLLLVRDLLDQEPFVLGQMEMRTRMKMMESM